jgi:peptidoglycan/LPS O-acetylase OafA/YrhL
LNTFTSKIKNEALGIGWHDARNPRLDHLRFFAASLIVVYHYCYDVLPQWRHGNWLEGLIQEGNTSVTLFIVLSGFLFGSITYGKRISYVDFVISRIARIYPAYIFTVLFGVYYTQKDFGPLEIIECLIPFANNFNLMLQNGNLAQLWSISVELQFYFIFPYIVKFIRSVGKRYCIMLILLGITMRALIWGGTGSVGGIAYGTIFGRIDQFMIGVLLAYLLRERWISFARWFWFPISVPALLATLNWFVAHGGLHNIGVQNSGESWWIVWPDAEGLAWAFVLAAYLQWPVKIPRVMDRILSWSGAVSYSVYLLHRMILVSLIIRLPAYTFSGDAEDNAILTGIFVMLPLVTLISAFAYVTIERPFFVLRRRYVIDTTETARERPTLATAS